jgi:hypothetical protein
MKEQWGLFGDWNKINESDVSYLAPNKYRIECYNNAPLGDYAQFNNISEYMNEKYGFENENIIVYCKEKQYVIPELRPPNVGSRRKIIGIAYRLENGFFIIMRMKNNKFLYAFFTSLDVPPDFPESKYKEVRERIKKVAKENGLKFNSKTKSFTPELYSIKDNVDMGIFKEFEGKIAKIEEQFEIPFYNPLTIL